MRGRRIPSRNSCPTGFKMSSGPFWVGALEGLFWGGGVVFGLVCRPGRAVCLSRWGPLWEAGPLVMSSRLWGGVREGSSVF